MKDTKPDLPKPCPALEALIERVIGAGITVHKALGSGLVESVYRRAMILELRALGMRVDPHVQVDVVYRGELIGRGYIDLLVDGMLVVELKAVSVIIEAHRRQTRFYLNAAKYDLGLIMNFHAPLMAEGLARVIR